MSPLDIVGKDELQPETTRPHPFRNSRDKTKLNAFRVLRALKTSCGLVSSVQLAQRSGLKLSAVKTCCRLLRKLGVIQLVSGQLWAADRTYTRWHRRQESDGTCKLWQDQSMGPAIKRASGKLAIKRAGPTIDQCEHGIACDACGDRATVRVQSGDRRLSLCDDCGAAHETPTPREPSDER